MDYTNGFILDIIARLNKQLSKRAINGDLRTLDNTMYVKVLAKLSKSLASRELKKQLKGLNNLYVNVGIKTDKGSKDKIQKNIQTLQQSIKDIKIGLQASKEQQRQLLAQIEGIRKNVQKRVSSEPLEFNLQLKKDKLISDIEYTGKRFSKLFSSDSAAKKYEAMMQRALSVTDKGQLSDARAELAAFTSEMKATGLASKSMGDRWRDLTSRAKDLFSAASIVRVAFTQMKEAVNTTIDLDKSYTDLIKVQSELTRSDYPDYLDRCNRKAQELATTQKALIEGVEEFSKSGYDLKTSNALTEKSTVLSNVGEMSASDSAKAIISGVQAYDTVDGYTDAVSKAGALIDKYNELGNTASITTEELAKGVQSVGSVFEDANTSVDQFLALLSSGNRQYQDADALALALRTSALRIRGASVELEEAGEDIEGVMSTLDNQKAIKALTGVDILESDQKTIRSIYDIFLDISKVYKDMADVDQSALLDILAGKHRASAISSTLNNMTEAETILQNSLNAARSAQREYDTYLESTEAHLQQFQAKLVETYSTFMNGDMISHTADIGTAILDLVNKTDLLKHSLIAVAAVKIGKGIVTAGGAFSGAVTQINTLGNAIRQIRELPLDDVLKAKPLIEMGIATQGLTDKNLKLLLSQKQLSTQDKILILQQHKLTEEQAKEKLETLGLTNATNANTAANTANTTSVNTLKGAFTGLKASAQAAWAAMSTLEKASVILAVVSTVWSIGSSVMSGFKQSLDDIRQKAKDLGDAFNSTKSEIEDYKTKIAELHAVINDSGSSLGDVTEARKNLMSVQDELIKKFGAEKDTIDLITEAVNGQTDAFDELSQRQWQEVKNDFNDSGFGNDMLNLFGGYRSNIDRMLDEYGNYSVKVDLSYASGNYKSKEAQEIRELLEANGMEISYTMNGTGVPFVELSGTADDVYNKVLKIQELFLEDNPLYSDNFSDYLTGLANSAEDMSEQYKEMYDNYILYEEIFKDNSYRDSFKNITDAYEEYKDAFATGDEEAIAGATKKYADIMASATEDAFANGDTGVADYFESMYPELQSVIEQWEFKTKILPDFDISGLKGKTENEVLEMLQTDGVQDGEGVFNSLIEKATEYGIVTGENSQKVQQLLDLLVELGVVQGEIAEAQDAQPPSFIEAFNSLDTNIRQKLLDLAKSGEITAETLSSTEEYNTLLSQTGLSAESAKNQILDMLSVQERLAGAAEGLNKLKSSYEEFKDLGFVTAQSIESLPDAFKELEGYDLFSEIAGDPTQGKEAIQQAFNDIVKEYIFSQDTLSGLVNASESQIQSYIANLKEMGVTNAEEVVNTAIQVLSQENKLLNAAEKEYMNYLEAKDGYDEEYLKSATSKNSQLIAALGDAYKGDYDNWCDLISKKTQAYNKFVNSLKSASNTNSSGEPLSAKGQAEKILKDTSNGTKNVYDPFKGTGSFHANPKPGDYTKAQVDSAREYLKQYEEINKLKEQLKFDLSTIDTNYGFDYSQKGGGGSTGKSGTDSKKEETVKEFEELFDWIERRIKKFQRLFDKWIKQAETAVTSGFVNKYYKKAASAAKNQLSIYGKAYNRYMAQANVIGLDEKYAKKVRNGTIDLEEIRAHGTEEEVKKYEELADRIKKYQDWYDKAQDSMQSFMETAEKLYNLPLDKAAVKVEKFNDSIDFLDKKLDNAIGSKNKNKLINQQKTQEKNTLNAYKSAKTESQKNLKSAKKELKKNKNLNADDGITKKERGKIKSAVKKNKEVNLAFFKENSAGYKAAVKYNEALKASKKATDEVSSAQQEYNRYLVESAKQKFDNIADDYNKEIQKLGWEMSGLDNKISEIEARGKKVNVSYYTSKKNVNNNELAKYKAEKKALETNLKTIKKGTDEWYDAKDAIQEVDKAISECVKTTYDLNNAANQLYFDLFDDISDGIKRIIMEQEFLQGLFAHEKNADKETGNFTEAGIAKMGSLSASYYASKENSDNDRELLAELNQVKANGKQTDGTYKFGKWTFNSLEDLQEKIDETYTKWQDDIKETYSLESSIADLMKEKYQAELDLLQELINAKKEALQSEKDLHDYQRTLDEKTKDISTIQKQIAAYSGDTSQEGMAKLQKLQKELSDKQDDLRETEYNRYISDQEDMLNKLYDEYEDLMSKKLDDFMTLVKEGLQTANGNTALIKTYLEAIAKKNGYDIETDGLFNGSTGGIEGNVGTESKDIERENTDQSGTNPPIVKDVVKQISRSEIERETAKDYIKKHASKAKKKKSKYSDFNKKIYENKSKSYKGTGKVLSEKELKGLSKELGVRYDGNTKKDSLYKKMKSIKFPGFKKGGIAKLIKDNGEDGITLARNGEGFIAPEHVKPVQDLVENVPEINKTLSAQKEITQKLDEKVAEKDKTVIINGAECTPVSLEDSIKSLINRSHPEMGAENINVSVDSALSTIKDFTSGISNMVKPAQPYTNYTTNNNHTNNVVNVDMGGVTLNGVNDPDEFAARIEHSIKTYPKVRKCIRSSSVNMVKRNETFGADTIFGKY